MEEAIAKRAAAKGGATPRSSSPAPGGKMCTSFAKNGYCYYAFDCNYVHPGHEEAQKRHKELKAKAAKQKAAAAGGEAPKGAAPKAKGKGE